MRSERWQPSTPATLPRIRPSMLIGRLRRSTACRSAFTPAVLRPGRRNTCCPEFRLRLGDPLLLEDTLVRYPALKVYVMHAGGFFPQNALMLMTMYPHVYVDISTLTWTPIAGDLLEPFLTEAKRRRLLDRVMFGSDQMRWPEAIALAIDRVNRLEFLTVEDKQDIFYDNAAKFLGLSAEEVARHHR